MMRPVTDIWHERSARTSLGLAARASLWNFVASLETGVSRWQSMKPSARRGSHMRLQAPLATSLPLSRTDASAKVCQAQRGIGFIDVASGKRSDRAVERHPQAVAAITSWAKANVDDSAIWTPLAANFHKPEKAGEPFSVRAAIRYVCSLDARKTAALNDIRQARPGIQTPVRTALNARWLEG